MSPLPTTNHGLSPMRLLLFLGALALSGTAEAATDTFVASGTWIAPAGVTSATVEVWGGGGAGGGNPTTTDGGGGGGGGGYSRSTIAVTPGNMYTVTVGAGGIAVDGAAGGPGGDSWFSTAGTLLAKGGAGGNRPFGGAGGIEGAGGSAGAGIGAVRFSGGNGGRGRNSNTGRGAPGGSSAGTAANGANGPNPWSTATAGAPSAGGGIGGNGGNADRQDGFTPASGNGGGGGGGAERNTAGGNGAVGKVSITYTPPPTVTSIDCVGSCTTNAASVSWLVTFSASVTGGSSSNFALVNTGLGGTPAITSVTGSGATRTVTASAGTGSGTLRLDMVNTTGVSPALTGLPFAGQVYTLDRTAPVVSSIVRVDPSPTALASVSWTVTFSKTVTGVNTADFALAQAGGVSGATITGVSPVSGSVYTVTASTGAGNGTLGLNLADDDSIADAATNPLGGAGAGNGNFTGEIYTVIRPVTVSASPTACVDEAGIGTQTWGTLTGPLASDNGYATASVNDNQTTHFLKCTGYGFSIPAGATITGITVSVERKSSGTLARDAAMRLVKGGVIEATDRSSATAYPTTDTVEAHGGAGDLWGTTWTPAEINAAAFGAAFAAQKAGTTGGARTVTVDHMTVSVDYTMPPNSILSIDRADADPTYAASVSWTVTFNTNVSGLSAGNFTLVNGGLGGAPAITAVTGGPTVWTVTASTGVGTGTLGLNMVNSAGVSPAISGLPFTGQVYSVRPPGTVTASPTLCVDEAGIGTQTWGTLTGPLASDNGYATASVNDNQTTHFLKCTGYGFSIPAGAIITGITVGVERRSTTNTDARDAAMRLVKGGIIGVTDRSTATTYTTTDVLESHGLANDLWGTTWTLAEINAAGFGAAFAARKVGTAGANRTIRVDHMPITVEFAFPAAPPPPGDFNAFETSTGGGAISGFVYTKLVGTGFSLDVVAILAGAQHGTFSDTVQVDLVTGAMGGLGCGSPAAIAGTSQNVNLVNGRGTTGAFSVATAYPNARVRVSYLAVTSCSTDNFSIRPQALSSVTAPVLTNAGTTGAPSARAGDAFRLDAVAGAGYNGTPLIDNTKITAHAGAVQAGSVAGAFAAANPASGTATGAAFTYSEVGHFRVGVNGVYDSSFTAVDAPGVDCTADFSNTLVGGRYGCSFGNSAQSAPIGRFTPDHFDVALNTPTFTTGCGAGGFTYLGQTFTYTLQPVITVTAKNSAGLGSATTQNYQGSWWKITGGSLTGKSYTALAGSLDTTGAPGTDPVIRYNGDGGGAGEPAAGQGTLTFGSGTGFLFTRSTPSAPFDAEISLAINVLDTDAIANGSNPARFGQATAGNGIAFNNGKPMRFGRLRLNNANGSQLVALSMLMETQYWSGSSFITNADDNCTSIDAANVGLGNYTGNLNSGETTPSIAAGSFSKGRKILTLSPPGAANNGNMDVVLNLGSTATIDSCPTWGATPTPAGANLSHLRGQWCGAAHTKDPTARAAFGVRTGSEEVIHIRENF